MSTMASHHLLALLLLLLSVVVCSTATATTAPTPSAQTSTTSSLVQSTCNATTYYDLCVSALAADPSSSAADLCGLYAIAVSSATTNAAAQAAIANVTSSSGGSVLFRRACAGKYGEARDTLVKARKSVMGAKAYDYAFVDVSTAAEYPTVCRRLFRWGRMAFPADLAEMAVSLEHLCTVAGDIIRLLL